jgi:hypothetical protein
LILEAYIDPGYRREQLEGLLGGDEGQFFDELFGLGRRGFKDIVDLEYGCEGVEFEDLTRHGSLNHRQAALDAATRRGDGGASLTLPGNRMGNELPILVS